MHSRQFWTTLLDICQKKIPFLKLVPGEDEMSEKDGILEKVEIASSVSPQIAHENITLDCPPDGYLLDGTQCGLGGNGLCWQGQCADGDAQCKELWGQGEHTSGGREATSNCKSNCPAIAGAKLAEQLCFGQNVRGVEYGNCGRDLDGRFMECAPENERCGLLHCREGPSSPALPNATSFAVQFAQAEQSVQCK